MCLSVKPTGSMWQQSDSVHRLAVTGPPVSGGCLTGLSANLFLVAATSGDSTKTKQREEKLQLQTGGGGEKRGRALRR